MSNSYIRHKEDKRKYIMAATSGYEQIKGIYDRLEDKISQDIFEKRLLYSLSGDKKYIHEMVFSEMKRYGNEDIMAKALEWADRQDRPVVVFGAGFAGTQIAEIFRIVGKRAVCFADNNSRLWETERQGLKIYDPRFISDRNDCCVVIGMNAGVPEVYQQLQDMGIEKFRIFVPEKAWWLGTEAQYFDHDIMRAHAHESFVDGGALDGNDSREFIKWCDGNFDAVYLFEPDEENRRKIVLQEEADQRIHVCAEGLWSGHGKLRFFMGKQENSSVSEYGNTVIPVTSIDEKLDGNPVSVIKMDIEGCELEALKGAEGTIKKYAPRLAVCVYHKPEDIIELSQKILELNSGYHLYLRHYSYTETETVLYAV